MKKFIFTIALLAVSLVALSGYTDTVTGTEPGKYAPQLALANDAGSVSLGQCKGEYVLLSFWKSTDALSREGCNRYAAWKNVNSEAPIRHISVNLDTDRVLFEEIVAADGLDADAQYNVQGEEAQRIVRDYRLEGGLGSILINPDGRIVEINPPTSYLSSLQ